MLNSTPPVGRVRSRVDEEGRDRLRAMVAEDMHKICVRGPKISCAVARCKMAKAKRKRLANVDSVLGYWRGGSRSKYRQSSPS